MKPTKVITTLFELQHPLAFPEEAFKRNTSVLHILKHCLAVLFLFTKFE